MAASGHYEARVNPIGPLYTNLLRSGFRVLDMDDWDRRRSRRAAGIAFVAPQKSFTDEEVEELLKAEEGGAVVILTTGEPDSAGSPAAARRPRLGPRCHGRWERSRPPSRPRAAASASSSPGSSTPGRSWRPARATRPLSPVSR